ncbi:MAG: 3-hydroxyacyl-CoA dehydrogenase [Burkholderiales bacterium]|nr:3-hydroxyacyl-CoA dehydrogenase [Burkholderiales bacterium]
MAAPARTVAIVGGGKMGGDIAAVFVAGGWAVQVCEPAAAMRASLKKRIAAALRALEAPPRLAAQVVVRDTLAGLPWSDVDLVIEAAPEILALKQRLFRDIESLADRRTIITTNSSSLRLSDVASGLRHHDRAAGMHWLTPANLAPVVEVVRGKNTAPGTIRRLNLWLKQLGKMPVNLYRDVPGMIINRLQHAMLREAFNLIDRGVATVAEIDTAVRYGFGFRYIACGPIRQRDYNGLLIHLKAAKQIYPTLHRGAKPPRCLVGRVRSGKTGVRSGAGFYRWDKKTLARELPRYEKQLRAALRLMGYSGARRKKPG